MVIKNPINSVNYCLLILFVFLFVYAPPFRFLPVNISTLLCFPILFAYFFKNKFCFLGIRNLYSIEFFLLAIILIYVSFLSVYGDFGFGWAIFVLVLLNVPAVVFFTSMNGRCGFDGFSKILVDASFFAAAITVFLFFFPELNSFIKFSLLKYDEEMMQFQLFRGFGIADELLFSYSIAQAIAFYLCLNGNFSWVRKLIYLSTLFFSIVLNAKIGILFCGFALFLYLLGEGLSFRNKILIVAASFALLFFVFRLGDGDSVFVVQLNNFYNEIAVGNGSNVGESSVVTLLTEMLFLPDDFFGLIFGRGVHLFALAGGRDSDSGWVLLLHFGGFVLTSLVILFLMAAIIRLIKHGKSSLAVFFAVVFFVANLKGLFFAPKPGMRMLMLVYFFVVYDCMARKCAESLKESGVNK